jgi:rhodanese-related sulfurtransferase
MSDGYAGDVTPAAAWQMLAENPRAVLIDVRTAPEWSYVGLPLLDEVGKTPVKISWQIYPEMAINPNFTAEVAAAGISPDQPVLLLCRSGVRSAAAAKLLTAAGFSEAYNVADGFEGNHDAARHRGTVGGWKATGLPWVQG